MLIVFKYNPYDGDDDGGERLFQKGVEMWNAYMIESVLYAAIHSGS